MTLAQTAIAFDLLGVDGGDEVREALAGPYHRTAFLGNVLSLAWAALATTPAAVDRLRSSP